MSASNLAFVASDDNLLIDALNGMSWSALLDYFHSKKLPENVLLSPGKEKHVASAQAIIRNEFEFNNERFSLGDEFDWKANPSKDIEWLILLHKFYYFKELVGAYDFTQNEVYAQKWVGLIDSWIRQVPDGFIDSQVTGRRLQQWILSYQYFVAKWRSPTISPSFLESFLRSLHSQTHYLCEHLTPEGNHRTLELYAIFLVAVTFPEFRSATYFLEFSTEKLIENIKRDLLPDGVHRELSTDYHHTVLKNYLRFRELASLNQIELPEVCDELLKRAIEFSCYVHKPDGLIPAINDGDCNSYLALLKKANTYYPAPFIDYVISKGVEGRAPVQRSKSFENSGYCVLRSDWTANPYEEAFYLFFDCASIGFGSHGHYDALNFEMAAYGHSLIVDPGRYTYNESSDDGVNWRKLFKSTAAHNTVVVDGLDQIPYRPGRPVDPEPVTTLKHFVSTTGFDFLHGQIISQQYPVVHERMIYFMQPEYWIVTDLLKSENIHQYDLYFHLSSKAQSQTDLEINDVSQIVHSPNLIIAQAYDADIQVALEQGFVSQEYGIKCEAPVVKFSQSQSANTGFRTVLYPYLSVPPDLRVLQLPIFHKGKLCQAHEASVLKICIKTVEYTYEDYFFINHISVENEYSFDGFTCVGRFLFLRRNISGQVINLQGEELSVVRFHSKALLNVENNHIRVSYQHPNLSLTATSGRIESMLDVYEILSDWLADQENWHSL
ncbi:MAG: alginate lyase family protein [Methylococcaceae bacterium]|nr:alginate lyase family protein [Methylococcaceae bacterium]